MKTDPPSLPVSCYIRALDEEKKIARTVRAALRIASEVVVVDSGSTDRTVAVAEAEGARVVDQGWLGYGHQKRIGEDACRHDWLLDLDADEVVSEALALEIRALFGAGEPAAAAYTLPQTLVDPAGRTWHRRSAPRRAKLYDRRKARMPADAAWDQLDLSGLETGRLEAPLLHDGFRDMAELCGKQLRAMTLIARPQADKPRWWLALRVRAALPFYFVKRYLLRGLWRNGPYGFMVSLSGAFNQWYRDALLYERHLVKERAARTKEPERSD